MKFLITLLLFTVVLVANVIPQDVKVPPNLLPPPTTTTTSTTTQATTTTTTTTTTRPTTTTTTTTPSTTSTTTEEAIDETTIDLEIVTVPKVETSTSKDKDDDDDYDDDSDIGSWIQTPEYPDNLYDASYPLYTLPQLTNPCTNTRAQPTPPCNRYQPPVYVPPIYNPVTDEPEWEEIRECPIGFVLNNSVCVPRYVNNCPSGYSWKDGRCVLSQVVCPINFDYDGEKCVERKICPPFHVWRDGKCEQPEPECPNGFQWNGYKCVVTNIQCQPGSVLVDNECVIESVTCPSGYYLVNGHCVEPPSICPPGYELQADGFCMQMNKKCPPGSVLVDGQCKRTTMICPPGTQRIGDKCYVTTTVAPLTPSPPTAAPFPPSTQKPPLTTPSPPRESTSKPRATTQVPTTESPSYPPAGFPLINKVCPDGYIFYHGQCYKCPQGYSLCNGICLRNVARCGQHYPRLPHYPYPPPPPSPPQNINININFTGPSHPFPPPPPPSNGKPYTIINNIEPINNTIHNVNNITNPVTLNNVNQNNIYVYTNNRCADGSIRTTIVRNNETVVGCSDDYSKKPDEEVGTTKKPHVPESPESGEDGEPERCCEVITPRQCKKRYTDQWICTHRRYRYCGKFCIADRLYMKPPSTTWSNSVLTVAPSPNPQWLTPCYGRECPPVDCSGCMDGSFNCSPQCYTYPCSSNTCTYVDQGDFCQNVQGEMCARR